MPFLCGCRKASARFASSMPAGCVAQCPNGHASNYKATSNFAELKVKWKYGKMGNDHFN